MRLGLFGGRFDPPHYGHLLIAEQAREQLQLDALWFVPAQSPPHKPARANPEARYEMLLLATATHPDFVVSRLELDRPGPSYTIDTVSQVARRHPDARLFFVCGVDAYRDIGSWHRARELVDSVRMVAVPRPGATLDGLEPFFRERVRVLEVPQCDISSSLVRLRRQERLSVRYLVPESVESYLEKKHLYAEQPVQPR